MNVSPVGFSLLAASLLLTIQPLRAEEKNGVMLTVQKKTLDRNDARGGYYSYDRIDRTQGLKVTVRNTTIKPQPEGEVEWTIIVRRAGYSSGSLEGFSGVEKLKALRPSDTADMVMGAVFRSEVGEMKGKVVKPKLAPAPASGNPTAPAEIPPPLQSDSR